MNVLIIEDSKNVAHIIESVLTANGFNTKCITSKEVYERIFEENMYDLIILNTSLRYGTVKLLREIRIKTTNTFVLGISTKSTWKEKVEFLNRGGDDVLEYPFPMQELFARIHSLLQRPKENNGGILRINDIEIDTQTKQVNQGKKDIPMRRREYSLLEYMVKNKNRIISRAELLDHVWDYRRSTGSNTVDVHIKRLRDKVNDKNLIETVHGFGYIIKDCPK